MRFVQLLCCVLFFATPTAYGSIDAGPMTKAEQKEAIILARKTAERTTSDFVSWTNDQTILIMQQSPVAQRPAK